MKALAAVSSEVLSALKENQIYSCEASDGSLLDGAMSPTISIACTMHTVSSVNSESSKGNLRPKESMKDTLRHALFSKIGILHVKVFTARLAYA